MTFDAKTDTYLDIDEDHFGVRVYVPKEMLRMLSVRRIDGVQLREGTTSRHDLAFEDGFLDKWFMAIIPKVEGFYNVSCWVDGKPSSAQYEVTANCELLFVGYKDVLAHFGVDTTAPQSKMQKATSTLSSGVVAAKQDSALAVNAAKQEQLVTA